MIFNVVTSSTTPEAEITNATNKPTGAEFTTTTRTPGTTMKFTTKSDSTTGTTNHIFTQQRRKKTTEGPRADNVRPVGTLRPTWSILFKTTQKNDDYDYNYYDNENTQENDNEYDDGDNYDDYNYDQNEDNPSKPIKRSKRN